MKLFLALLKERMNKKGDEFKLIPKLKLQLQ